MEKLFRARELDAACRRTAAPLRRVREILLSNGG